MLNSAGAIIKDAAKASQQLLDGMRNATLCSSKGLQVLKPRKSVSGFKLVEKSLDAIFYHPDVINNPLMIISIAGAMREGKSFFMNLLVMYLEANRDPSCFDKDIDIPKHFKWKAGTKRETVGIFIWSKPYVISMKDNTKVAVLLMDTQGTFDTDGHEVSSAIFAFSTLISSVQLYNIKGIIHENHLKPLKVFTEYASQLKSSIHVEPFQKLHFILRDWQVPPMDESDESGEESEEDQSDDEDSDDDDVIVAIAEGDLDNHEEINSNVETVEDEEVYIEEENATPHEAEAQDTTPHEAEIQDATLQEAEASSLESSHYDLDQGQEYLDHLLADNTRYSSDVSSVRKTLKDAFAQLECSLFPSPGATVSGYKRGSKHLKLSDVDEDFKKRFKEICTELFSEENLQLKQVHSLELTGETVLNHIHKYYQSLELNKISMSASVLEANKIANAQTVVRQMIEGYNEKMDEALSKKEHVTEEELQQLHDEAKEASLNDYDVLLMDKGAVFDRYKQILITQLRYARSLYWQEKIFKEKRIRSKYEELVLRHSESFLETDTQDFALLRTNTLGNFEVEVKNSKLNPVFYVDYCVELKELTNEIVLAKTDAQYSKMRLPQGLSQYLKEYKEAMKKKIGKAYYLKETMMSFHQQIKMETVEKLESNALKASYTQHVIETHKTKISSAIDKRFSVYEVQNKIRLKEVTAHLEEKVDKVRTEYMKYMEKTTRGVYVPPSTLQSIQKKFVAKIMKDKSWDKDEIHQRFKKIVKDALENKFEVIKNNTEEKKGKFREAITGVQLIAQTIRGWFASLFSWFTKKPDN